MCGPGDGLKRRKAEWTEGVFCVDVLPAVVLLCVGDALCLCSCSSHWCAGGCWWCGCRLTVLCVPSLLTLIHMCALCAP